jgi:hypothetical protein
MYVVEVYTHRCLNKPQNDDEDEVGKTCSTYERREMLVEFYTEYRKE